MTKQQEDSRPLGNRKSASSDQQISKLTQVVIELVESIKGETNTTIVKKSDGQLSLLASRREVTPLHKHVPFDTFAQVLEGYVEIVQDKKSIRVDRGSGMIIPAHSDNIIQSEVDFRILLTVLNE